MRLVLILVIGMVIVGCNRGDKDKPATTRPTKQVAKQAPRAVYPEEDAVAILLALDTAEIMTSRIPRETSQNDEILRYAGVVMKDHADIMQLVAQTGVVPRENAISARIKRDADSIARGLSLLPMGLNNTYMEEQVKSHRKALQTLDSVIVPSVKTPALRTLLDKLRPAFVAHLQRSMQILAVRRKETAERGEQWVSGLPAAGDTLQPAGPSGPPLLGRPVGAAQNEPRPVEPSPRPKPRPKPVDTVAPPPPDTLSTTIM